MVSGPPSTGKTSIFLTNPGALVLNFDRTELPRYGAIPENPCDPASPEWEAAPKVPWLRAGVWPTRDERGNLLGVDGKPFRPTFEHYDEHVDKLVEVAGTPAAPRLVALDTIAGMIELAQDKATRGAKKSHWRELDGRAAWDDVYNWIIDLAVRLRSAGYGVFLICHIVDKTLSIAGSTDTVAQVRVPSLTITENFWSRIFWRLEFSAACLAEDRAIQRTNDRTIPNTTTIIKDRVTEMRRVHFLTTTRNAYGGIVKSRVPFPETILSRSHPWHDFAAAYAVAQTK
jgi:hypothetical protein